MIRLLILRMQPGLISDLSLRTSTKPRPVRIMRAKVSLSLTKISFPEIQSQR